MTIIKGFAVGNGDTYYVRHSSDNFSTIDCDLNDENAEAITKELKPGSQDKGVVRFISTHPDEDHFGGIEKLDDQMPIRNFYVVKNNAIKDDEIRPSGAIVSSATVTRLFTSTRDALENG
jgi:beta-lactamase superfamily II metal-dependent hydrolase